MRGEEGAVLMMVLIGLAILAALAGVALRLDRAGLRGLQAEAALMTRHEVEASALALIAARMDSLPQDGRPIPLTVEGAAVIAEIRRAEGLVNPAHARLPLVQALFQAKGAAPDEALRLARLVKAHPLAGPWDLAPLLPPDLWTRVAPDVTFLGDAAGVNLAAAPPDLAQALAGMATVDLTRAPLPRGLYEIALSQGGPVTRLSVLQTSDGRFHPLMRLWPVEAP